MANTQLRFPFPAIDISSLVSAYFEECESPDDNCFLNTRYLPDLLLPSIYSSTQENDNKNQLKQKQVRANKKMYVTSKSKIGKRNEPQGHEFNHLFCDRNLLNNDRTLFLGRAKVAIDYAKLQSLFHLPVTTAIKHLHISMTTLKATCRKLGIKRWPYRQIKKFKNSVNV